MKRKTYKELETERDALLSIVQSSQDRAKEAEGVIELLVICQYVTQQKIDDAKKLLAPIVNLNDMRAP